MEMALRSLSEKSVQRGHSNDIIYTDIHHIIKSLIGAGILPKGCYLGRKAFCGIKSMTRAAIGIGAQELYEREDAIKQWALDRWLSPEEIFKVLNYAAANGVSNGEAYCYSNMLRRSFHILNSLPVGVRSGVLQSKYNSISLFSAV